MSSEIDWYVAELMMRISVAGTTEIVVHRNTVLVQANDDEEAYRRALELGAAYNSSHENPAGQLVTMEFVGLVDISHVDDALEHGAELWFSETIVPPTFALDEAIPDKQALTLFSPRKPSRIDYRSREVVDLMKKISGE